MLISNSEIKSAYLNHAKLQPVKWYLWSEEVFELAKKEDKPILVDVGASWCHWCHVMDDESYSNPEIAEIINDNYIPVKIDRDEMPEVDRILQKAVNAISGESGWPLTVFLTPDGKVFFGGTYFPPNDKYGRIGFKKLLLEIIKLWKNKREEIIKNAENLYRELYLKNVSHSNEKVSFSFETVDSVVTDILSIFDWEHGGLGFQPKFPHPTVDQLLLLYSARTGDTLGIRASNLTLRKMYYGGIMDQIGGGFHRYSTDREWWIPHFEKLLIDNAEILISALNNYLITNDHDVSDLINLTINYILRDLGLDDGFANSEDSDSEGIEGKFYTWTIEELKEALNNEYEFNIAREIFSFNIKYGFVEGRKILKRAYSLETMASKIGTSTNKAQEIYENIRKKMFNYRENTRKRPLKDINTYTYPNFRTIEALLYASKTVEKNLENKIINKGSIILNSLNKNVTRRLHGGKEGLLEDYASSLLAAICAYEVLGNIKYLDLARDIGHELLSFKSYKGFIDSKNSYNISELDIPNESPNSLAIKSLIKLSILIPTEFDINDVEQILFNMLNHNDLIYKAGLLLSADAIKHGICHIIIVDKNDELGNQLHNTALLTYYPFKIVEKINEETIKDTLNPLIKEILSSSREQCSRAYVCIGRTCSLPITKPEQLKELIKTKMKL